MPSQSRSQRRRQQQQRVQRQPIAPRPVRPLPETVDNPVEDVAVVEEAPERQQQAAPERTQRKQRRVVRPAPEPVDYTTDYQIAGHDLRRIIILSLLLLVAMVALRFSGVV